MSGKTEVKAKLLLDSATVASVGTYLTKPAIFGKPILPTKYSGKAIGMYNSSPINGGLDYGNYNVTVNCFAKKYNDAETISNAAYAALNRQSGTNDSFFVCSKLQVIPPRITGGDYNAPIEVLVRKRAI